MARGRHPYPEGRSEPNQRLVVAFPPKIVSARPGQAQLPEVVSSLQVCGKCVVQRADVCTVSPDTLSHRGASELPMVPDHAE